MTHDPKIWFITGCSSGFGRLLAEQAAARGDFVVATARRAETLDHLVAAAPDNMLALPLDVTRPDMVAAAVKEAEARFGGIDILVNNAGYVLVGGMEEVQPDEYRALFETNFFGVVSVTQAVLPGMRRRRRGHVINISSMGGISGGLGMAYYGATKFALTAISESLSQDAAHLDIRVTIVEPGGHSTNATASPTFSRNSIDDYAETVGQHRARIGARASKPLPNPANVVRAILAVADAAEPPLHLPVGEDALARLNRKLDLVTGDRDRWMHLIVQS